jgi:hypothetical protein
MAQLAHNRWKFAMKHAIALRCMQTALGWAAMLSLPLLCGDVRAELNLAPAGEQLTARDLHVWGRFGVGTWKQVRIVTESIGSRGEVVDTTTTETKTTLLRADASRLTLRIEATVEVAGKRFQSQPQIVEYGYYGEAPNEPTDLKTIGTAQVTIGDRQCPCQVQQVVANVGTQKQITKLFVSDDVEPYILRRDTTVVTSDNKVDAKQQTTAEVVGLDRPYRVLHDVKPTAYERTIQHTPRGTNFTDDVTCTDVPGGIVARTSKELDEDGHIVRRSNLELIDYKTVDDNDEPGKFLTRREARRARRGR